MPNKLKNNNPYQLKQQKPRIVYRQVGLGPEDIESRLNRAFDILFEEVIKNKEKEIHNRH